MANCDVCGVPLGEDGFDAYRCGGTHICIKHLQDRLRQEQETNANNVANYQMHVTELNDLLEHLKDKLAAAEERLAAAEARIKQLESRGVLDMDEIVEKFYGGGE